MFVKLVIVLCLVGLRYCAEYRAYLPPIPEKFGCQKGCYIKETDEVVPFGTNVTPIGPGQCYRISCTEEWLVYASCGVIGNDNPNLTISETDDTKPYPECCPTLVPKTDLTESDADK
ncbi:hypothetical protein evm_008534 [Chilo suppressalis]|nr:hypothetical protein evm_008534 [Chilo suppressalis]